MKKKLKGRSLRLLSEADGLTLKKVFKMVRLTVFCFLISLFQAMAIDTYSQMTRLSLNLRNESIEDVLKTIEDESDYFFLYNKDLIKVEQKVDVTVEDETIKSILDNLFEGTDISYEVFDRQIVLSNNYATSELSSQQKTISGKVTDETGQPMPGVTIAIKGTTLGTSTDSIGNYLIANLIPNNSILVFSFVGMVSQEIKFENQTSIHVIMKSDAIGIDEVIAVGYGVQKKMLNTGSTFNIRGEELQRLNNSSPMDGLKGISAGVNIIQNNGVPGSGTKVLIRGAGTIGNSNPLYIVDGISVGDIDFLSSSDIESIDVLKDAASAAIYGSRAANGVILVTTKKGALGKKPLISYDFYYGLQSIAKNPNVLDAQQYVSLINEANINSFRPIPNYSKLVPNWEAIESGESSGTHWFDEVYQKNAPVQSH
jgi:TonB-dependent SusC/RagA subfamily outer membrane receptor